MFSSINDPSSWALPVVLEEMAQQYPDKVWLTTIEGDQATFSDMARDARKLASYFASQGVQPGDAVGLWMFNSCDFVRAWLALGYLGAISVMLNTELSGSFLTHQLNDSGVKIIVVDPSLVPRLKDVSSDVKHVDTLIPVGDVGGDIPFGCIAWSAWRNASPYEANLAQASAIASIMYTSGTSGPSKGVLMPHAHCFLYGVGTIKSLELTSEDTYYITLPLFHANGLFMQLGATLIAGIPAVLRAKFSASAWLEDIRQSQATVTNLIGATASFVTSQPPTALDSQHRLRAIMNAPNVPDHEAIFRSRFGVKNIVSGFGMTECNIPAWGRLRETAENKAGWVHTEHFEVAIVNPDTDVPVPYGELGEIVVRPKIANGFMAGYHNLPTKTVEAWRNLWFHTGDAGTITENGLLTYVDRIKDCIRRRGENISATEIEQAVNTVEGIAEVAAYAVPADLPGAEDEVMLALVLHPACVRALGDIEKQIHDVLPRFARPKYLRLMDELPKTATGKIQRATLRNEGALAAAITVNQENQHG